MKKLLIDSCTKTAFSYENIFCKQCDGTNFNDMSMIR